MRKKLLIGGLGIVAAASAAVFLLTAEPSTDASAPVVQHQPQLAHTPESPLFNGLPVRRAIGPSKGELFSSPPPPKPPPPTVAPAIAPAPPAPPPMPYRIAGQLVHDGKRSVVLAKGDQVFTVREGDVLDAAYRVQAIKRDSVTLVYIPLDASQVLVAGTALGAEIGDTSSTAHLRWEGPKQVRTGDRFEVTLKMTSREAVRAAPLQLHFDVSLLEPVEVRRGGVFRDGIFNYRILPGGSIYVGASGKAAPAVDEELLVVSFKPIRPALAAELHISTLTLQGVDGKAIRHQDLAAFRTVIVQ